MTKHVPPRKFSSSICAKYKDQTKRHEATPANARWMLRNTPTSQFGNAELNVLRDVARLAYTDRDKNLDTTGDAGFRKRY